MRKAVVQEWVETEARVQEWDNALAKKAKATGRNYSRLLSPLPDPNLKDFTDGADPLIITRSATCKLALKEAQNQL